MMPDDDDQRLILHEPTEEEKQATLGAFFAAVKESEARRDEAATGLDAALEKITEALTHHWTTGSGRRLRQIVWSIYNTRTLLALGDVLTNFDADFGEAVAVLIRAKLAGVDDLDDRLKRVLKVSGEFARYEDAQRDTPEDEEVLYPPMQISAESLRRLANSAAKLEARIEAERRAEAARYEADEAT